MLTTLRSGEPPSLYMPWPQTLYNGNQGTLSKHSDPLPFHSFSFVAGLLKPPSEQSIS